MVVSTLTSDEEDTVMEVVSSGFSGFFIQVCKYMAIKTKTRILAPMDGVITDKSAEIGEVVAQASPIMKIASGNNLQAEAYVSELDVKKIAVGDKAEIVLSSAAENNVAISAKIKTIYPAEKSDNGVSSYKVIFQLRLELPLDQ